MRSPGRGPRARTPQERCARFLASYRTRATGGYRGKSPSDDRGGSEVEAPPGAEPDVEEGDRLQVERPGRRDRRDDAEREEGAPRELEIHPVGEIHHVRRARR